MALLRRSKSHRDARGVVFIYSEVKDNSRTIDIVRQHNNFYIHKQIELKNGLIYIRLKKRLTANIHA